jgi:hypothetical protein
VGSNERIPGYVVRDAVCYASLTDLHATIEESRLTALAPVRKQRLNDLGFAPPPEVAGRIRASAGRTGAGDRIDFNAARPTSPKSGTGLSTKGRAPPALLERFGHSG